MATVFAILDVWFQMQIKNFQIFLELQKSSRSNNMTQKDNLFEFFFLENYLNYWNFLSGLANFIAEQYDS